jgi:hypothetical protein
MAMNSRNYHPQRRLASDAGGTQVHVTIPISRTELNEQKDPGPLEAAV